MAVDIIPYVHESTTTGVDEYGRPVEIRGVGIVLTTVFVIGTVSVGKRYVWR